MSTTKEKLVSALEFDIKKVSERCDVFSKSQSVTDLAVLSIHLISAENTANNLERELSK